MIVLRPFWRRFGVLLMIVVVVVVGVISVVFGRKLTIESSEIIKVKKLFESEFREGSIRKIDLYPNTYSVKGVLTKISFSEEEKVGDYWFFGKAHFIGVDGLGKVIRYKVPIAVGKERGKYVWVGQNYGSMDKIMNAKSIKKLFLTSFGEGELLSFFVSSDVGEYFKNSDGGHKELFENDIIREQYLSVDQYINEKKIDILGFIESKTGDGGEVELIGFSRFSKYEGMSLNR